MRLPPLWRSWPLLALGLTFAGCGSDDDTIPGQGDTAVDAAPGEDAAPAPGDDAGAPGAGSLASAQSGTRLKAVFAIGPDGTEVFVQWRDTQLGAACRFTTHDDQLHRCTPDGPEVGRVIDLLSTDAACSDAVAALAPAYGGPSGCAPVLATRAARATRGCATTDLFRVGAPLSPRPVWRRVGTSCVPAVVPDEATLGLHRVTSIPTDDLVTATLVEGEATDGVAPVYLEARDGARAFQWFQDRRGGFRCDVTETAAGPRCFPLDSATIFTDGAFADAACTAPAAVAVTWECHQQDRASVPFAHDGLGVHGVSPRKLFRGGARLATVYRRNPGCLPDVAPTTPAFAVGPEVPLTDLLPAQVRSEGAPLTRRSRSVGSFTVATNGTLSDPRRERGTCFIADAKDGSTRCLPAAEDWLVRYFADDACSWPVVANHDGPVAYRDGMTCPPRYRAFDGPEPYDGPVYQRAPGGCTYVGPRPPDASARVKYKVLRRELAPADLLPITVQVR